ncbi:hybrid sensor histidine kinase/response regulator [Desulfogranum mediterraneum]|uniref:hybrid sensor histidine kinase/response regulator n=1 Tax=Desulfogranum mediterraneum TaxID=160661 RepID=UPI00137741CC|nr:ATP-binding protein [Desulfogranum mediterraneum]
MSVAYAARSWASASSIPDHAPSQAERLVELVCALPQQLGQDSSRLLLLAVALLLLVLLLFHRRQRKILSTTSQELLQVEARYRLLFEQSPISLWEEDLSAVRCYLEYLRDEGISNLGAYFDAHPDELRACAKKIRIVDVNARTLQLYELEDKEELSTVADLLPLGAEWIIKEELLALLARGSFEVTVADRTLSGQELTIELRVVVAAGYEDTWERVYVSVLDITEQTRLKKEKEQYEQQMQQSRKLEAIGSLAGGIAHDFNNILAPIIGRAELMILESGEESGVRDHCRKILDASKRARDLVRQILTFSREVDQEIKPLAMQPIVDEVVALVRPTLPATIALQTSLKPDLPFIMADSTQIHQVVMNLVTNAFHAMEETSGTLSLELDEQLLTIAECLDEQFSPGRYLCLRVADSGHGMDRATLEKIFNPYFTTKARDKGTGLGLSVVHGILRSYGGTIRVESEVGVGTTFSLFLPVVELRPPRPGLKPRQGPLPRGDEHILLVDDEHSVAEVCKGMLEKLGYKVTMRVSSLEALEAFRKLSDQIDLVITDLTMPQMTGLQLVAQLKQVKADIPGIICTGFSEQLDSSKPSTVGVDAYLNKPVLMEDLAYDVRAVLDEARGRSADSSGPLPA